MSRFSERLDSLFPRRRAMRRLSRMASVGRRVAVSIDRRSVDLGGKSRMIIRKNGAGVDIACNIALYRRLGPGPLAVNPAHLNRRPAAIIHLFLATRPEIRTCSADTSDGSDSGPGIVSFCSPHPDAILVPDFDFYATRGYADIRRLAAASTVSWRERSDTVLWRGSSTGWGVVAAADMSPANANLLQRTRLCLILRDLAGTDAGLTNAVQSDDPARSLEQLRAAGILGAPIDQRAWLGQKFAIDVDGNSNAWANFFNRLLLGCCVIKIASPLGFRQWYYDDIVAWQHYVPVKSDLSDLIEKLEWCRSEPGRCEEIAAAGHRLAMAMTFEREMARGVDILNRALAGTDQPAVSG